MMTRQLFPSFPTALVVSACPSSTQSWILVVRCRHAFHDSSNESRRIRNSWTAHPFRPTYLGTCLGI